MIYFAVLVSIYLKQVGSYKILHLLWIFNNTSTILLRKHNVGKESCEMLRGEVKCNSPQ